MKKKNKTVKLFAILGLLWIIVSVVWTGILVLTSQKSTQWAQVKNFNNLSQEDLQKIIDQNKTEIKVWTGEVK